jgi:hypothetical protein
MESVNPLAKRPGLRAGKRAGVERNLGSVGSIVRGKCARQCRLAGTVYALEDDEAGQFKT